jgi:hypothetical protein
MEGRGGILREMEGDGGRWREEGGYAGIAVDGSAVGVSL